MRSGRDLASQIAAASTGSLLLRLTYGFTCAGGSNRTSCSSPISALPPCALKSTPPSPHARRQLGKEQDQLAAREFAPHNDGALRLDGVNLKHPLRQIEPTRVPVDKSRMGFPMDGYLLDGFDHDLLGARTPLGAPSPPSFAELPGCR